MIWNKVKVRGIVLKAFPNREQGLIHRDSCRVVYVLQRDIPRVVIT